MRPLIKSLYVRLLQKPRTHAQEVERRAIDNMFMYRTIGESSSQLNFNFVANQNAHDEERDICTFIIRYGIHYRELFKT
jgi:hypothetical protein